MKRILLSSLAVFIVFLSQAQESQQPQQSQQSQQSQQVQQPQIKKGTVFIGGSIGFSKQSASDNNPYYYPKATNINFSPSIGWAIKDNLVFGVTLGYGYQKNTQVQDSNYNKSNTYNVGVFLRKYKSLGSGFFIFAQGNLNYNYTKTKNYDGAQNDQDNSTSVVGLGFNPGVAYRINSHWQIETIFPNLGYVNYNHTKYSNVLAPPNTFQHSNVNTFSIGSSLSGIYQFSVGVQYII